MPVWKMFFLWENAQNSLPGDTALFSKVIKSGNQNNNVDKWWKQTQKVQIRNIKYLKKYIINVLLTSKTVHN